MAVTPQPGMVRDYWPRYRRRALVITIFMQIAATIAVGSTLVAAGVLVPTPAFWITVFAVLATTLGVNIILATQLLIPLKNLASALTHISGEPTIITPPSPNAQSFERDGFKPLLQLIYRLAAGDAKASQPSTTATTAHATNFTTALDNAAIGFVITNSQQQVSYANKKAPVHITPEGDTVLDLIFEADDTLAAWLKDCEEHAVHAEHTWQRVANKIVGEDDRKIYDVVASYQKGSEAEVVISMFDRTATYQPEDDSLDFLAFAAHELRGPITVIRGYLDVLGDELAPQLSADQVQLMQRLVVSANRLGSYVNNILNASRYDRRHLKMHLAEDSIANIYSSISDDMQLRASSQNRLLAVHIPPDLPTVAADSASVGEVISNLIDNAVKYSNEGGAVDVTARADGDFVKVAVTDRGIGMPGNVVSNLFHKFYRSHRSRETFAGTGIGLYICKAIIESHGGKIEVRSREGEGSAFEFSLPIYATVADKLRAASGSNEQLIRRQEGGWIKNHAMFRG